MTTAYLNFHAPVMPLTAQHLMAAVGQLVHQQHSEIYLMLSTPGGQVPSGLTIYNFLTGLPCKVTTHNVGNVDSIGNAIFLAGSQRKACPHSTFMFHGVGFEVPTSHRFEEKNLRESLQSLLADQKRIADIISLRSNIKLNEARKLFREARTKDADYALKSGIVHEIADLIIPSGAPIVTLVFN